MKPSELIALLVQALQAIGPVADEIASLLESGQLTPAQAHGRVVEAAHDHFAKLGDGHLIQLLIQYAPQLIALILPLLTGGAKPPAAPGTTGA